MGSIGQGLVHRAIALTVQGEDVDFTFPQREATADVEAQPELLGSFPHPREAMEPPIHQREVGVAQMECQLPEVLRQVDPFHQAVGGNTEGEGHGSSPPLEDWMAEVALEPQCRGLDRHPFSNRFLHNQRLNRRSRAKPCFQFQALDEHAAGGFGQEALL